MARGSVTAPSTYTPTPSAFGRDKEIPWKQPTDVRGLVGLRSAEVQHAIAARTRDLMKMKKEVRTFARLAEKTGLERKRLGKLLSGDAVMAMRDYQALVIVLPELLSLTVKHVAIRDSALVERFPALGAASTDVPAVPGTGRSGAPPSPRSAGVRPGTR